MLAQLRLRRGSPPELCHTQRLQALLISILQQFWSTAVARTARGQRIFLQQFRAVIVFLPDVNKVLHLAMGIQQPILVKQPGLQLLGELFRGER